MHLDFTQAIAICIARELASSVVNLLLVVAPRLQTGIDAVLVGIHPCAWMHGAFAERIGQEPWCTQ
jgi:hypothetical protein